jgi:hypothetical protein
MPPKSRAQRSRALRRVKKRKQTRRIDDRRRPPERDGRHQAERAVGDAEAAVSEPEALVE